MADVIEYRAPEGIHAHEAPFLLQDGDDDARLARAHVAAYVEIAGAGALTYDPAVSKFARRQDVPGFTLTPFQEKVCGIATGNFRRFENMLKWKDLVWKRFAERGWAEPGSERLTPAGLELRKKLEGYRAYLRQVMTERLHATAVEGKIDRDTAFAVGFGIISPPNAYRSIAIRLGWKGGGWMGGLFNLLGGDASRQHIGRLASSWLDWRPTLALAVLFFLAAPLGVLLLKGVERLVRMLSFQG